MWLMEIFADVHRVELFFVAFFFFSLRRRRGLCWPPRSRWRRASRWTFAPWRTATRLEASWGPESGAPDVRMSGLLRWERLKGDPCKEFLIRWVPWQSPWTKGMFPVSHFFGERLDLLCSMRELGEVSSHDQPADAGKPNGVGSNSSNMPFQSWKLRRGFWKAT